MGTPVWGAVGLVATRDARTARRALLVLAALLVITALFVVAPTPNGDSFGPYATGVMGAVVTIGAIALPARWRVMVAHFIAAQACLNALLDIRVLLRPSQVVDGVVAPISDAHNMALMTFGTTATWAVWTWAIAWLLWSLVVLYAALRISGARALSGSRVAGSAVADARSTA
jgi:hypothetical protein